MSKKMLAVLLSCFCLSAIADEPQIQLVIWAKDGSKTVYPMFSKPKITFTDADLIVTTNGLEAIFNLDIMARFTYESSEENKCTVVLKNEMATYCSPLDLDFSSVNGLKAYVASTYDSESGILTMTEIENVPAGEGVLLIGNKGTYEIPFSEQHSSYENLLKGVTVATEISPTENEFTNYILVNGNHGTGFYRLSSSGLLDAGKAYLQLPAAVANSRMNISIKYENITIGVSNIEAKSLENNYYRLDGMRIITPSRKGIYIKNGKKIVIK